MLDIRAEIKSLNGIIECSSSSAEIANLQDVVSFYENVLQIDSPLAQHRMIAQRGLDGLSAAVVAVAPTVKANQTWISLDGIEYTIFSNRKNVVSAYTFDLSADKSNGNLDGSKVHWVKMDAEEFAKEFSPK